MKNILYVRHISFVITILSVLFMIGCAEEETKVEPTFSSLWENVFSGCGASCHSANATDGTQDGPDMSSKSNFYNNLYEKTVSTDYPLWVKTGNCDNINMIAPGDESQSTLAAALVSSVSDSLGATCNTAYNVHSVNGSVITDGDTATALINWIKSGAAND